MIQALKPGVLALSLLLVACGSDPAPEADAAADSPAAEATAEASAESRAPQRAERPPEPTVPQEPALAPGHHWYLVDASSSTLASQSGRSAFQLHVREAMLAGQSGCNRFDAGLAYDSDGQIRIQTPAATRRVCQDEAVNRAEREYLQTLPRMRVHRLVGQRLRLETEDGAVWLEYEHGRRPQGTSLAQ